MRHKNQIGPPHFLFWSSNQPPWWIMGNMWSSPCDALSFTCQPRCSYNWNWDLGKQVNATLHWAAKWEKTHTKPHQPSSLRLHWLGCPAAGECRKAHWWTTERTYFAVGNNQRRRKFIWNLVYTILWSLKSWNCCYNFLCCHIANQNTAFVSKILFKFETGGILIPLFCFSFYMNHHWSKQNIAFFLLTGYLWLRRNIKKWL